MVLPPAVCPCAREESRARGRKKRRWGCEGGERERGRERRKGREEGESIQRARAHAWESTIPAESTIPGREEKRQPFARGSDRRKVRPGVLGTECGTARAIW